jgi:hypothetical protein
MTTITIDERSDPPIYRLHNVPADRDAFGAISSAIGGIVFIAVGSILCWNMLRFLRPEEPELPLLGWIAVQGICGPAALFGALLAVGGIVLALWSAVARLIPGRESFHLDASGLYREWTGPFGISSTEFHPFERLLEFRRYRDEILAVVWEGRGNGRVLTLARALGPADVDRVFTRLSAEHERAKQQWSDQGLRITRENPA